MLGLSTYAYAWRRHPQAPAPFTEIDVFDDAIRLNVGLVQLCDLPELETATPTWLKVTRRAADDRGITLETGTKGIEAQHLLAHLERSAALGSSLLRSMLSSPRGTPSVDEAVAQLSEVMPAFEAADVTLGLETYEQFSTDELLTVIERVGSPRLGIVLDPGNSVARLEHPADVISKTAPHVVNAHVKDFTFSRMEETIGFTFAGVPLGTGLLDYPALSAVIQERDVNQIIEHWLPRQRSVERSCKVERQWIDNAVTWIRHNTPDRETA